MNTSSNQQAKQTDTIAFNMTLSSEIPNDTKYKVTELDIDSLLKQNDDTLSFDFKKFYMMAYRDLAVTAGRQKVNEYTDEIQGLNDQMKEVRETLDRNPDDEVALRQQESINRSLETAESNLATANQTLQEIKKKFKYDENTFSDYTTKMYRLN